MHGPDVIDINHLATWIAIIGGGLAGWATLRRMRTNELRHLEDNFKLECKEIRKAISEVDTVVNQTRDRVSSLEGWRNGLKGGSPGGK